jgi:cupin 2 barrel domain protein
VIRLGCCGYSNPNPYATRAMLSPGGTPHSFEVMEGGEVIDVFTPQREDYL